MRAAAIGAGLLLGFVALVVFDGWQAFGRRAEGERRARMTRSDQWLDGVFDLTMVEVGAYNQAWPDWHIGPEQAVLAHRWLHGKVFMPIHWGLFDLAMHGWTEPVERVAVAARTSSVTWISPKPGQSIEPTTAPPTTPWWPDVPWKSAAEDPIVSTNVRR